MENIDKFSYHEVMDRSYLIIHMIDNYLLQHPVVKLDNKLKDKIEKSAELLYEVYNEVGSFEK
jgi:hypothetical protein